MNRSAEIKRSIAYHQQAQARRFRPSKMEHNHNVSEDYSYRPNQEVPEMSWPAAILFTLAFLTIAFGTFFILIHTFSVL